MNKPSPCPKAPGKTLIAGRLRTTDRDKGVTSRSGSGRVEGEETPARRAERILAEMSAALKW